VSETAIVAVVVAVLGVFGGKGLWDYLKARRLAPIDTVTAVTAAAHEQQTMSFELLTHMRLELDRVSAQRENDRRDLEEVKVSHEADRQTLGKVQEKVALLQQVVDAWANWHLWLVSQWSTIRTSEVPPAAPSTPGTRTVTSERHAS
jgi:F420-0:gamma-glutamyl ligase-like protein